MKNALQQLNESVFSLILLVKYFENENGISTTIVRCTITSEFVE